jgi:hypothetical protein
VKEQSHKREMRAALRGDFERLRARRGGDTALIEAPAPDGDVAAMAEPEGVVEPVPETASTAEITSGGSWLDRLRGRA